MKVENIYKKADGTKYRISVSYNTGVLSIDEGKWSVDVDVCEPGKRKYKPLINTDDYKYRGLTPRERDAYIAKEYAKYGLVSWIRNTQRDVVDKIKDSIETLVL